MKICNLIVSSLIFCLLFACNNNSKKNILIGSWRSQDGETVLKITSKQFIIDNESPVPEDYFLKGDTILTSFEGNQPYTKFIIKKLDERHLDLLFPDSVLIQFSR